MEFSMADIVDCGNYLLHMHDEATKEYYPLIFIRPNFYWCPRCDAEFEVKWEDPLSVEEHKTLGATY
jgi:hypothetical protein